MRKTLITAAAIAGFASTAYAGGMSEPMMDEPVMAPEIVVEESTGSSGGFVLPLILLALIAAVAVSD